MRGLERWKGSLKARKRRLQNRIAPSIHEPISSRTSAERRRAFVGPFCLLYPELTNANGYRLLYLTEATLLTTSF